ncbi:unnamed protein product [Lepeophtheirus salmonis]|uniref:(salmon louse) hypothetical protein n=1 Tax=Lepeophtheirus salmonis TaxID=72036 RepID=A0A7R8CT13_LEPSM|nr:unnamed protein product [Lepeophtheirus salmonis]CAF2919143.1 unnamed protein product [Lepeophtheirus salmonis]
MKPNFNHKDAELCVFGDASSKGWSQVLNVRVRTWTDSAVVFHWIQSEASNWKIYFANGIQIIQDIIGPLFCSHVSGVHNPADHGCRGLSAAQFVKNDLWFNGPHWLSLKEEYWPKSHYWRRKYSNRL